MAKDPAFLFYPNDYLGGTLGMTFEQKGAYIELLMVQFNRGHMTSHMIGQVLGHNNGHIWETIKDKFEIDEDGKFFNKRLEIEQNIRRKYSESRKKNINGNNQYSKKDKKNRSYDLSYEHHMTEHMEDEDENRNKDDISFNFKKSFLALAVEKSILSDWLKIRKTKKAVNTETAYNAILKQIEISGISANECITKCVENSWSGFKAEWLTPKTNANKPRSNMYLAPNQEYTPF